MKRIILLLLLFYNVVPTIKDHKLTIAGPSTLQAQNFGSEELDEVCVIPDTHENWSWDNGDGTTTFVSCTTHYEDCYDSGSTNCNEHTEGTPIWYDCAGVEYGSAYENDCGDCVGGWTGRGDYCDDPDPGPLDDEDPPLPCDVADSLASHAKFKEACKSLQVAALDISIRSEVGYTFGFNQDGGMDKTFIAGQEGEASIKFNVSGKIDGFMHSHYSGLLSTFSPYDLYSMAELYDKYGLMNNPFTFTACVVTPNTQYILIIDDLELFKAFSYNLVQNSTLEGYSYAFETIFNISPKNSSQTNEKNFLLYLEKTKSGLKLFKGNADLNKWEPKKVKNGNVVDDPC